MFLLTHSLLQCPLILNFLDKSFVSLDLWTISRSTDCLYHSRCGNWEFGLKYFGFDLGQVTVILFVFVSLFFSLGIIGGLTSVITSTVEGVKTEGGVSGFISGLGKGLVGTVTKPVAGALDFASETAQAVRDTATLSGPRSVSCES